MRRPWFLTRDEDGLTCLVIDPCEWRWRARRLFRRLLGRPEPVVTVAELLPVIAAPRGGIAYHRSSTSSRS